MSSRLDTVRAAANGRWAEILQAVGMDGRLFNHKHQPCPACGGRDRFRFTDHGGKGCFVCNHCTPDGGSGFDLLMLVYGYTFKEAVKVVAQVLGLEPSQGGTVLPPRPVQAARAQQDDGQAVQRLLRMWESCKDWTTGGTIAAYLAGRGIADAHKLPIQPHSLRFASRLRYWHKPQPDEPPVMLDELPAMVACFTDWQGNLRGLHTTYLQRQGDSVTKAKLYDPQTRETLPVKKMRATGSGKLKGAAIPLFAPDNGLLGVCEGIETAIAAYVVSGVPMWACGSAHGLATVELPADITDLVIIADNDTNGAGINAAHTLQNRMRGRMSCRIWQPETVGADALDVLNRHCAETENGSVRHDG